MAEAVAEGGSEGWQRQIESDQDRSPVRLLLLSIPPVQSGKIKEAARLLLNYRTQAAGAPGAVDSTILANFGGVPGFLGICSGTNPLLLLLRSLTPTGETPFFAVLGPFRRGVRAQCASIPFQPFPRKTCMRRSDCGRHGTGQDQHWDGPRNHVAGRPGNDSHCPLRPSTLQDFIKLGYTDWMDSKTFICA